MIVKTNTNIPWPKRMKAAGAGRMMRFALIFLIATVLHSLIPQEVFAVADSKTVTVSVGAEVKYEAEDALLTGVTIGKSVAGYSGTGHVDGGSLDAEGDKITFTVNVATAASYPLVIRFNNTCGACEKAQFVSINGGADKYTTFNGTTGSWQDLKFGNIDLKAGANTIVISKSWGWTHIDYIIIGENDVMPPSAPANLRFSNINQTSFTLAWDASTDNIAVTGYDVYFGTTLKASTVTTTLQVNNLDCHTEYAAISVKAKDNAGNVSTAGNVISVTTSECVLFDLKVNNGSGSGTYNSGKVIAISANAAPQGKIFDRWTGSSAIANPALAMTSLVMPEAATEISATYKDVDPAPLLDPAATKETLNLWNYLKSIYGQKMLTGCWTETQFGGNDKVESCTGETPAIWGQDMNSWYRDRKEFNWNNTWSQNIAGFKAAHKRGQILQVNWHWQMPSSKVNGVYTRDAWGKNAAGTSLMMTTQQWADIVTPGTALYDAMIEDIDYHVVNFLKKIVDDKGVPIPIIFRPLHEIDGGWFWWTCPSDPTKTAQLFKIMQDRIMNHHGCHNLIWVYNPGVSCNGGSWPPYQASENARRKLFYPGDAYCDITGIDLYDYDPAGRGTFSNTGKTFRDAWNMMKALAPSKMIALCESEGLPDAEKTFTDTNYAPWLYCLPWYSDTYKDNSSGITRDLCAWNKVQFKSPYVINAGDFIITSTDSPLKDPESGISIYPNPTSDSVTITFLQVTSGSKARISLTDLSGKTVYQGEANGHTLVLSTREFSKGVYLVKVSDGSKSFCDKLIIK
ncbi:MAG TPA: glycosyl hydrolase [Prolixibacteraceae bacterium]|nr:glycosyl hydrolase [Prolixibacteraceae bacterium]